MAKTETQKVQKKKTSAKTNFKNTASNKKRPPAIKGRKMIPKMIYNSNTFLDLLPTAQLLYTHLIIHADDDGFVKNVRSLLTRIGRTDVDLNILNKFKYIIYFSEADACVITDWKKFNNMPKSIYVPTKHTDIAKLLDLDPENKYILRDEKVTAAQ